jgi:esterase/lipase superfamily enzyme
MSMPKIRVFYATNRRPIAIEPATDPVYADGTRFGSDLSSSDGKALRFGEAEVMVPRAGEGKLLRVDVAPENLTAGEEGGRLLLGSAKVYDELRGIAQTASKHILVVIHGYANDFEGGLIGAAEIAERTGRDAVFAFCWPAKDAASGLNYWGAREWARDSGEAIGRAFGILLRFLKTVNAEDRCDRKVDLVAHSMGNYALRGAVQFMRRELEHPDAVSLIDDLVLVAADDDNDTLARDNIEGIALLVPKVRCVTVYYSRLDYVLQWSDKVKMNPDRLGQTGPRSMAETDDRVFAIDVSDCVVDAGDGWLDHWYHRRSPAVMRDLKALLDYEGPDPGSLPRREALPAGPRRYRLRKSAS